MSFEQRKHIRHSTTEEIIYSSMDTSFAIPQRVYHLGTIINRSQGGMAMQATTPHRIEEALWVEGIIGNRPARTLAVKWIRELENDGVFEIGMQF